MLTLQVNQDKRSSQPEVLGVPAIDTRSIETQVLVRNGETIVLGGIYESTDRVAFVRVPFIAKLPVVGKLFRHKDATKNQTELLIFITPRIVQQTSRANKA